MNTTLIAVTRPEIIEAGRLTFLNIFKGADGKFYSSQIDKPDLGYEEINQFGNHWNFTWSSSPETLVNAEITEVDNENIEKINHRFMCECKVGGFLIKAVAGSVSQTSYINPKGVLIETIGMTPYGLVRSNYENSTIHMMDDNDLELQQNTNEDKKVQNLEDKINDLKLTNNKPLIEIGKILETDFYDDEEKNLYYRDFPDTSKLNDGSIYPLHRQERDFWIIKDGYTVNLSVVNWMDYNKMREGPHNESELPNLYVTLSTPNKVFELIFNIDGELIPVQEKIENDNVNLSLEKSINKDKKDGKLLQDEIKSLNISINNEYFNVKLLPDCELQNLIEEDILNIYELVSSYFKKNTGFWKKSVTGHEIVMLWAQSRDPRILNIKIQNKEKFITLGLGSLLSQIGFSCDATLMLTQNFKRK